MSNVAMRVFRSIAPFLLIPAAAAVDAAAQQTPAPTLASVGTVGVTLRGVGNVADGRAFLTDNARVTAGDKTAVVNLQRGGTLQVCPSASLSIANDTTTRTPNKSGLEGLMFTLNSGGMEAYYTPSAFSDIIATPDLRFTVSGPGQVDLKIRINAQGDTCVDNAGQNAPYVLASSLRGSGAYRVRPGQRVQFIHGSLADVVDTDREPCGCPSNIPDTTQVAKSGGPSSTPSDTAFPIEVSEGLQAPLPAVSGPRVVYAGPGGAPHAQISASLSSNTPLGAPPTSATLASATTLSSAGNKANAPLPPKPFQETIVVHAGKDERRGFFGALGHFFSKLFGAG